MKTNKIIIRVWKGKILINSKEFELKEDEIELLFSKNLNIGEKIQYFFYRLNMTFLERKEYLSLI
jgi:hypothetical protein